MTKTKKKGRLTALESETVMLLSKGKTPKQIADALSISIHTVYQRVYRAKQKLGAYNHVQLILLAVHFGEIEVGKK